ncbi:MAG: class II aldolase/adducin family protein [Rhodospirillales bacterium]
MVAGVTHQFRVDVLETARAMNRLGINQGMSGNVSRRVHDGMLITPSGMDYDKAKPDDIVPMDFSGNWEGRLKPSSEWRFHGDIYAARTDAHAVVHTHSTHATALACLRRPIPAFHYMVAVAGGTNIRCAPYATYGTQNLSEYVLKALDGRKACLLANHGLICIEAGLEKALALAVEVETLARQYLAALTVGEPTLLDETEMAVVIERFKTYGAKAQDKA